MSTEGYIYFVQPGEERFIKIGWTTKLRARLSNLQTGNHLPLSIQFVMSGTRRDESGLHSLFHRYALEGEWFHFSDEIAAWMDRHDDLRVAPIDDPRLPRLTVEEADEIARRMNNLPDPSTPQKTLALRRSVNRIAGVAA